MLEALTVFMAKRGARAVGIDIGSKLIAGAKLIAQINQVDCEFQEGSASNLPFETNTYDIVVGLGVLHHLSSSDVKKAVQETYRVLKESGVAVFREPVENSKVFDLIQNLFPRGRKNSGYYRPSILQRRAWSQHLETLDDRAMTTKELISAGSSFSKIKISCFGLLVRLTPIFGNKSRGVLNAVDNILLKTFLKHFCQNVLVEYCKNPSSLNK